jgi:hypothetical protein
MPTRVNEELRSKLLAMRTEDRRVRQELIESGELGGAYVPRMEEVHRKNAAGLRQLIEHYGWPTEDIAGKDGAEAAWLIAQHSIGEPDSSGAYWDYYVRLSPSIAYRLGMQHP